MLITLRESDLLVGCSPRTLRARIQRGDLRGKKEGRAWWIESRSLPLNDEQRHRRLRPRVSRGSSPMPRSENRGVL